MGERGIECGGAAVSDWPDEMPGLDVAKALRQLGGKKPLYCRLLSMFLEGHTSDHERLAAAYSAEDWAAMHEISHALKGVSGNLAATELYDTCLAIEEKLKKNDHDLDAEVSRLAECMPTTLSSMSHIITLPQA